MKFFYLIFLFAFSTNLNAVTKLKISEYLKPELERCMLSSANLRQENGRAFVSIGNIECSHYIVLLTTDIYVDPNIDSIYANPILSHSYDNLTFSSLLKSPPENSLFKRYGDKGNVKATSYLGKKTYKNLMSYIYKNMLPHTIYLHEVLKINKNIQGLSITQDIEVNFLTYEEAYAFLSHVLLTYYKISINDLEIGNM